jgi:hypothetical protein
LAILRPLASGFELEECERAGRGFDDTIERSTDDAAVDRHREGNFMKRSPGLVQHSDVFAGAEQLVGRNGCVYDMLEIPEVIGFIAPDQTHRDVANCRRITDPASRITDSDSLKQPMHKRANEPARCGRCSFPAPSLCFGGHDGRDR